MPIEDVPPSDRDELAQLLAPLKLMIDEAEIRRLLTDYCRGCDRADESLMAGVYASDSLEDHGKSHCSGPEFARETMHAMQAVEACHHMLAQSTITLNGDRAGAETYFVATVIPSGSDTKTMNRIGGRYLDTLLRESGKWKIEKRVCVRDWSCSTAIHLEWLAEEGFQSPGRGRTDPSYAIV